MSAMESDRKTFHPPKWCRVPRDPARRRQVLSFVRGDGAATPQPVLEVSDKAIYTVGRGDTVDVRLRGDLASRLHAAVLQDAEGQKYLVDLKSTHGTFIEGKKLTPHTPAKWKTGVNASFGLGPKAEVIVLGPTPVGVGDPSASSPPNKRAKTANGVSSTGAGSEGSDVVDANEAKSPQGAGSALASLYDGLPEATKTEYTPKPEAPRFEPLPPPEEDPTKVIFLDIDGVLRPLHSRQDAFQHARTIDIGGSRVPLLGNSEAKAGIDFWPSAMRALRHVIQKTGARLVLSSDWRKQEVLQEGIAHALEEYRMPPLYSATPDLDQATPGVIKALHSSFREKRCKEIRKWVARHPKVTHWVAIDDVDLSLPDKEAKRDMEVGLRSGMASMEASVFLDPSENFVRTNPQVGFTMELARLAVCILTGMEITQEHMDAAYGAPD